MRPAATLTQPQGARPHPDVERARIAAERLRSYGAERKADPRLDREYRMLEHVTFPFDKEEGAMHIGAIAQSVSAEATIAEQRFSSITGFNKIWLQVGIPIVAIALIGIGIGLMFATMQSNMKIEEQVKTFAASAEDSGETAPTTSAENFTASTDPRHPVKVKIKSIGVDSNTTQVGVNSKGNVGTPASIKHAAWYTGSASPVDNKGGVLMVGHVGTDRYPGVFAGLHNVTAGDSVEVTMGDGKKVEYAVSRIEDVPSQNVDMGKYLERDGPSVLHIITCTGDYNARTHTYTDRLIVTATIVAN